MKNRNLYFFWYLSLGALLFYTFNLEIIGDSDVVFMRNNVLVDLYVFIVFAFLLIKKQTYLYPSAIFCTFFYIYSVFGKAIWIYREQNWFNESGDPKEQAIYFSGIGLILVGISSFSLLRAKVVPSRIVNTANKKGLSLFLEPRYLVVLLALTLIGAFIFTSGFSVIPLFTESMDESRVALVSEESGGRGLGFFLLLFGIAGGALSLFSLRNAPPSKRNIYILFIVTFSFLLALYSGRFLPMIPFILYMLISQHNAIVKSWKVIRIFIIATASLGALMYFGAVRQFGNAVTMELVIRYLIADLFPEFRMTVYIHSMSKANLADNVFFTVLSGLFPNFFFSIFGLNKHDYFNPIGFEFLKMTQFDANNTPGIRASLFGELSMTGDFLYFFLIILVVILLKLDRSFFVNNQSHFGKFKKLSIAIFLAFSIPYGSLFLISVIEWCIILFIIEKYFYNDRSEFVRLS